jgi:hypothetical protein
MVSRSPRGIEESISQRASDRILLILRSKLEYALERVEDAAKGPGADTLLVFRAAASGLPIATIAPAPGSTPLSIIYGLNLVCSRGWTIFRRAAEALPGDGAGSLRRRCGRGASRALSSERTGGDFQDIIASVVGLLCNCSCFEFAA